jgi:hypothetical protein
VELIPTNKLTEMLRATILRGEIFNDKIIGSVARTYESEALSGFISKWNNMLLLKSNCRFAHSLQKKKAALSAAFFRNQ